MAEQSNPRPASGAPERERATELILSFAVGALVGIGLAVTWIPERRRRRRPAVLGKRYRRVRKAGAGALDEIRKAGRETAADFREELAASIEAAREEFRDLTRSQIDQLRKTARRQRRKLHD